MMNNYLKIKFDYIISSINTFINIMTTFQQFVNISEYCKDYLFRFIDNKKLKQFDNTLHRNLKIENKDTITRNRQVIDYSLYDIKKPTEYYLAKGFAENTEKLYDIEEKYKKLEVRYKNLQTRYKRLQNNITH